MKTKAEAVMSFSYGRYELAGAGDPIFGINYTLS